MKPPTPNLIATIEYWKPIKTKLSSILFFLLVLSAIFILFILNSPGPFSINNQNQSSSILEHYSNSSNPEQSVRANSPSSESNITSPPNSSQLKETVIVTQPSSSGSVIDKSNESSVASQATSSSKYSGNIEQEHVTNKSGDHSEANESGDTPMTKEIESQKNEACDLFEGRWVKDERGSLYTNTTCPTLPDWKNCGKYGKDQGFVYWRWKPDGCELPRFDARMFLRIVRGKKLMFIGDSLARNMMESLLCLLSQVSY